jgi:hypothetical protein
MEPPCVFISLDCFCDLIFLLPTLYVWIAGERDVLPGADETFAEATYGWP